ncbi:hypothetical protein KI659_05180 [Litoribacter alkaliphilus]|uniref:Lipoprotein n=1 Tax=Litoribacter ruber TaxID=702568 RepID=A0AAP2CF30_9BACT|nr:hypothetical protein [Litoribacter alkaliphilus]MBS9523408.1 hypothetical protein [Litoribacter alkaliphilus]
MKNALFCSIFSLILILNLGCSAYQNVGPHKRSDPEHIDWTDRRNLDFLEIGKRYKITMNSGNTIQAKILSFEENSLKVESADNKDRASRGMVIDIPFERIVEIQQNKVSPGLTIGILGGTALLIYLAGRNFNLAPGFSF